MRYGNAKVNNIVNAGDTPVAEKAYEHVVFVKLHISKALCTNSLYFLIVFKYVCTK